MSNLDLSHMAARVLAMADIEDLEKAHHDCTLYYCVEDVAPSVEVVLAKSRGFTGVPEGSKFGEAVAAVKEASGGAEVLRLCGTAWFQITSEALEYECKRGDKFYFKVLPGRPDLPPVLSLNRLEKRLRDQQEYGSFLQEWTCELGDDPSYLWNSSQAIYLCWPFKTGIEDRLYPFIGRSIAQALYERILSPGSQVQVMGAKGSGKTVLTAAVCNQIQQSGLKRVVFLDAERLLRNFFLETWKGLLLAFYGLKKETEEISRIRELEGLWLWCHPHFSKLLFVVDDFESLEPGVEDTEQQKNAKAVTKDSLLDYVEDAAFVRISSVNSRERIITETNDKKKLKLLQRKFLIDGPYLPAELKTWRAFSSLSGDVKQSSNVEYLTGGMPGLIAYYEAAKGDENEYRILVDKPITHKLWTDFIGLLDNRIELEAADKLIMKGEMDVTIVKKVKLTCFYEKPNKKYSLLCPYLETQARNYLQKRYQQVDNALATVNLLQWVNVVCQELSQHRRSRLNPARVGWNVERLVIDVMRDSKRVFSDDEGSSFGHVLEYAHGMEAATCSSLSFGWLLAGVLLVPMALNEKAVDVVLVKIVDHELQMWAMQITIAKWKMKSRKMSHRVWKTEVASNFQDGIVVDNEGAVQPLESVSLKCYYIMPDKVKEADIPADEEDEDDEANVLPRNSTAPEFKKFGDVHSFLRLLDGLLDVAQPSNDSSQMFKCMEAGCENCGSQENHHCYRHRRFCACRNVDGTTPCGNKAVGSNPRCAQPQRSENHGEEQVFFKRLRV